MVFPSGAQAIARVPPSARCAFHRGLLSYYRQDPYAHYDLGLAYMHKALAADSAADLDPALQHFRQVIAINPDLDQAKTAKQNIANIQKALGPQQTCGLH